MRLKNELLPCPHCGCKRVTMYVSVLYDDFQAECTRCGATSGYRRTREEAIEVWNRRVNDEGTEMGI